MKRALILILSLLCALLLFGCGKEAQITDNSETSITGSIDAIAYVKDFGLEGYFLRLEDGRCAIVLANGNRESGFRYLILNNPPWMDQVDMDAFNDGDHIIAKGPTIAELTPPILDIYEIELLERGSIDNIDPDILAELSR